MGVLPHSTLLCYSPDRQIKNVVRATKKELKNCNICGIFRHSGTAISASNIMRITRQLYTISRIPCISAFPLTIVSAHRAFITIALLVVYMVYMFENRSYYV